MKKILVFVLIASIMLSGCSLSYETENMDSTQETAVNTDDIMDKGPVKGGILKIFSTFPDTLNPLLTKNIYVRDFTSIIFESLVALDRNLKPQPVLAEAWDVSANGLTWTFKIREGVTWHDNMPLTAEDVEFTIQSIMNGRLNSIYQKNVENIASFIVKDSLLFQIELKKPNSFTPESMTFPIIPKHYFSGEDILNTPRNMAPVGTGPYKFLSYEKDNNVIKLAMNDKWWKTAKTNGSQVSPPYIAEVDVKLYESSLSAINAFQTKDVDIAFIDGGGYGRYSSRSDLVLRKYSGKDYEFLAFNLSRTALSDKSVRQAIACAIDRNSLITEGLSGEAAAAELPILPDAWPLSSAMNLKPSGEIAAKDILTKNGWREGSGYMYKNVNGAYATLNMELLVNEGNDIRNNVANKICQQLKGAGINLKVRSVKWEELQSALNEKRYDIALVGCSVTNIPDISFLYSSKNIQAKGDAVRNIAGYSNTDVDRYLDLIMSENDMDRRKAYYLNMYSILSDELPYIGLYFNSNAVLYSKRIRGEISPNTFNRLNDISKWYIPVN